MEDIKIVDRRQTYSVSEYKILKCRGLKCNANIYFNKQCLLHNVIPNYANVYKKTPKHVQHKIQKTGIREEINISLYEERQTKRRITPTQGRVSRISFIRKMLGRHFQNVCPHLQLEGSQSYGGLVIIKNCVVRGLQAVFAVTKAVITPLTRKIASAPSTTTRNAVPVAPGLRSCRTSPRSGEPRLG
jgi:hypothetical protein